MSGLPKLFLRRQNLLIVVMIAMALGIAIDLYTENGTVEAPAPATAAQTRIDRTTPPAADVAAATAQPQMPSEEPKPPGDLFAVRTWEPPRPVIDQKALPPPPPQAPPLPFRFLGKINDPDEGTSFMLSSGNRVITVKVGDTIDSTYRVEGVTQGQLTLIYQPMNIRQTLSVGSDS